MKKSNNGDPMSPEEFEKQLKQRPVRQAPAEWRAEILSAAKAATASGATPTKRVSVWSIIGGGVAALLELRPKALVGLGAAWVIILTLHFSTPDGSQIIADKNKTSGMVLAEVREQRLFFAELIGTRKTQDVEPPKKNLSGPRSERYDRAVTV